MTEGTLTQQTSISYLQHELPGIEEAYLRLLLEGVQNLSKRPIFTSKKEVFHQLLTSNSGDWHQYFNQRKIYYRSILQIWPTYFLHEVEVAIRTAKSFEDYVEIYRQSGFGIFLSNTKTLSGLYPEILPDWETCYQSWISGTTRLLRPYSAISKERLETTIRNAVNQVIVDPEKFHSDLDKLTKLVRRHYQLALTEQKR